MPTTFGECWRLVRLSIPSATPFLVQSWVQDTYRQLSDRRPWNYLTIQGELAYQAQRTLTCTPVNGSTTVTSAAQFLAADAGRQFRVGTYPIYTILSVDVTLSIAELSLPYYGMTTGAVTATILDAYGTLPATFEKFSIVTDPINQRLVPWWASQEELALLDPTRQASDSTPRLLIASSPSVYVPTLGQINYEYWPKPSAAGALQYYGINRPVLTGDDTVLPGLLGDRPDILRTGALAKAAAWPGTQDLKNPYFNLNLAMQLQAQFEALALQLDLRDDDIGQQSWSVIPWQRWSTWNWAYDTTLLRMTDATIGNYWGGGVWGGGYF